MFLKFRYRLGYESLCREVGDSITWRRFCRIPLDGRMPHPDHADEAHHPLRHRRGGCNEALLAKAAGWRRDKVDPVRGSEGHGIGVGGLLGLTDVGPGWGCHARTWHQVMAAVRVGAWLDVEDSGIDAGRTADR
jgi:hypothetical protein